MVFFDTNIWIELLAVSSPEKEHEIRQARAASELLQKMKKKKEEIVTCKEQLIELIHAVLKIQMRTFNRRQKSAGEQGVGGIKEFRKSMEYQNSQLICSQVYGSMKALTIMDEKFSYSIEKILTSIQLADINDIMYFFYCQENNIRLYTFDGDMENLETDNTEIVEVI